MKIFTPAVLTLGVILAFGVPSTMAFHQDGVGACNGCHLMHEGQVAASGALLLGESSSDVCLTCHSDSNGRVLGNDPLAPPPERGGGNFVFLFEDNLNDAPGGLLDPIQGEAAGHNVIAPGNGLIPESRYVFAPGGNFPSDQLGCTSCHDPHGNTHFRMLHGRGAIQDGAFVFTQPAPIAAGIPLGSPAAETKTNHTAYQSGMSQWCANCHGANYHGNPSGSLFEHPTIRSLGPTVSSHYNRYDGDNNPILGSQATAYLPEVPFEDPANTQNSTTGPASSSRLMCLTCHRAHGSSSPSAGRWDFNIQSLGQDGIVSGSYSIPNPYNDAAQSPLCSKCHLSTPSTGDVTIPQPQP